MSQTKAHPDHESGNSPSDALEQAMHEADDHAILGKHADPIPPADHGGHAHSPAAHLESSGMPHTKSAGNPRRGLNADALLREPPTVVQRVGKQHK